MLNYDAGCWLLQQQQIKSSKQIKKCVWLVWLTDKLIFMFEIQQIYVLGSSLNEKLFDENWLG